MMYSVLMLRRLSVICERVGYEPRLWKSDGIVHLMDSKQAWG